jgi:hypothetical protein
MGGPGDRAIAVAADGDHPGHLEALHCVALDQLLEHPEPDRLPDGNELERRSLVFVEGTEALGHQLGQTGRSGRERIDTPQTVATLEQIEAGRLAHELPEVQRVAGAPLPQPRRGERLHRAVEGRLEQVAHRLVVEGGHLDAIDQAILPQGGDRVGRRLLRTQRPQQDDVPLCDELVEDDRRCLVEPLGVVDNHHRGPPGRQAGEPGPGLHERGRAVARRAPGCQQRRQCAQRDRGGRPAGDEAHDRPARGFEIASDKRREAGLADPGGSCQQHSSAATQQRAELGDLLVPPAQRPRGPHPVSMAAAWFSRAPEPCRADRPRRTRPRR